MSNSVADRKSPALRPLWGPEANGPRDEPKRRWPYLKTTMQRGVRKYPLATLLAGFALGAAVGWFIKRR